MTFQFAAEIVEPFQFFLCIVTIGLFCVLTSTIKFTLLVLLCDLLRSDDFPENIDQNREREGPEIFEETD